MRMEPCILGTVCVPWDESYRFDERAFREETRFLLSHGLENLYVFGTAGEGYAVTDRLFSDIARVFFDEMRCSRGHSQLGIIAMSTAQAMERIEIGLEIGFREFQISLPPWGRLTDAETRAFFDDVLGSYPDAAFLHYNTPRGLRVLTGQEYSEIAHEHPNLVATKSFGSPEDVSELLRNAPELCHFFGDINFGFAVRQGPCGLLASISTLKPEKAIELWSAGVTADTGALDRLTDEIRQVLHTLHGCFGREHIDGAYDKVFCRSHTPGFPLRLLPPYQGVSEAEYASFAGKIAAFDRGWAG